MHIAALLKWHVSIWEESPKINRSLHSLEEILRAHLECGGGGEGFFSTSSDYSVACWGSTG